MLSGQALVLEKDNQEKLFACILQETDVLLKSNLLRTLVFFYERYMLHWLWNNVKIEGEQQLFDKDLLAFIENFIENKSLDILLEVAYILAMLGDRRS